MISIHDLYRPILMHFRKKRMKRFYQSLNITEQTKILDVGGSPFIWEIAASGGLSEIKDITILNVFDIEDRQTLPPNVHWIVGDGCNLPFADGEFDVVFSNSVIEHLGKHESQICFANEIRRVGKAYWVQTPDPRFVIEPHYLSPFVHWLPMPIRRRFVRYATVWGILDRPSDQQIKDRIKELRLIGPKEFRGLFPDAEIIVERFVGMPKSLVAKMAS
jgi:hypothetical protein